MRTVKKATDYIQNPVEAQECYWLCDYLNILMMQKKIINYTHVANGSYKQSRSQQVLFKTLGMKAGFPDYLIFTKKGTIAIEMKRRKGSVVSPEQWGWLKDLREAGIVAEVAKGFTEAKEIVERNL